MNQSSETNKSKTLFSLVEEVLFVPAKKMFNKLVGNAEKKHQEYADVILYNDKGEVLLLHRTYTDDFMNGTWGFPGGHIDRGENPTEAAQRELFEETGIAAPCSFLKKREIENGTIHYFEAKVEGLTEILLDAEEHRGYEWVQPSQVKDHNLIADLLDYVNDLLSITEPNSTALEDHWSTIKIAFDNDIITEEQFFKAREQYLQMKKVESFELIAKAFDEDLITPEQYMTAVNLYSIDLEKGSKRGEAVIGEKREFGGRMHIKTADGWKYFGKGTGAKAKEHHKSKESSTPKETTSYEGEKTLDMGHFKFAVRSERSLGGSGGAVAMMDTKSLATFVVKSAHGDKNSRAQLAQEALADDIYNQMGISASMSQILTSTKEGGGMTYHKVAPLYFNVKNLGALSEADKKKAFENVKQGFVLDCLLLNWDVVGANMDNIVVDEKLNVRRIDNGGSLLFRARNGEKPESALTAEVKEIESMRSSKNPVTQEVYGSITDDEIKAQVEDIVKAKDGILALVEGARGLNSLETDTIKSLLEKRINWLEETYITKSAKKAKKEGHDYLSDTTNEYFKKWDSVELEGNAEIKDAIKQQIMKIESNNDAYYSKFAKERGISVEEYKGLLQQKVESFLGSSDFFRATDIDVLDTILNDSKRFKSQFETKTSHGSLSPESRASVEKTYFGFNPSKYVDKEKRPIYGYFSDNKNGVQNEKGEIPPRNHVSHYGQVTVKLKRDRALKKATVTFYDSLGYSEEMAATPASYPHFTSFKITNYHDPLTETSVSRRSNYVEAQYHGQLTVDDIDSIVVTPFWRSEAADFTLINKAISITRKTHLPVEVFGNK